MRRVVVCSAAALLVPLGLAAQAPGGGRFPPESLVNVQVFPRTTPVIQVIGTMRNITGALGVRCQYCHVGEEGMPLERFDFASDERRNKVVARQMMRMVQEINRRLDTIPERPTPRTEVTCTTCHRAVQRPVDLVDLLEHTATTSGLDSATRTYRNLRRDYFGRASYDFDERTLNIVAGRLGRARRFDDALALARLNDEFFPRASSVPFTMGDIHLARGDTAQAVQQYQAALRRDPGDQQARFRLRQLGRS